MSGSRSLASLLACVASLGAASRAHADDTAANGGSLPEAPRNTSSLEGFVLAAPTIVQGDPANDAATNSFRRVGVYGEFGVAYRSHYFLDPFISAGYATLASADTKLSAGEWGDAGTLHQHLGLWLISPGVTTELWRFRLRLGIGIAIVKESNTFHSDKNTATQTPLAAQVGLGFNCYSSDKFRLDVDARYVKAQGADVSFGMLGVTARGDLITFGGGG